jgi:hypothetical protein
MSDLTELVTSYLQIWNEPDADARKRAIDNVFADDASYTDPLVAVEGRDAIGAVVAGAREQFPGLVFRLIQNVDAHHNIARFTWELVPEAGGEAIVIGFDVAVADASGKIRSVYGFIDKAPAAA